MHNNINYKITEVVRVTTGVIAITAAAFLGFDLLKNGSPPYEIVSILFFLSQIAMIAAMIMYAIYVFSSYGKTASQLLGYSALTLAGAKFLDTLSYVLWILMMPRWQSAFSDSEKYSRLMTIYTVDCIERAVVFVIFLLVTLKYFGKIRINIKILLIIALAAVLSSTIFISSLRVLLIGEFVYDLFNIIFGILYISPFLLFAFFCPQNHKRVDTVVSSSTTQE